MKKNIWTLLTAGLLILILLLYTVTFTVQAGSSVVVKTLGAITRVADKPGLYAKWPWPIQSVSAIDNRVRLMEVLGNEILTDDEFNIITNVAVGWKIEDPSKFWTKFQGIERRAEDSLRGRVMDARKQVVNDTRLMDLVTTNEKQSANYIRFEKRINDLLAKGLETDDYGISVDFLKVKSIAFPEGATEKVNARMIKERERKSSDLRAQGENLAKQIMDNADLKKQQILADAEAEAIRIRGEGDAAAAEHYKVFKENPELANFLRKCESLKTTLQKKATVVISTENSPFDLLKNEPPMIKSSR